MQLISFIFAISSLIIKFISSRMKRIKDLLYYFNPNFIIFLPNNFIFFIFQKNFKKYFPCFTKSQQFISSQYYGD